MSHFPQYPWRPFTRIIELHIPEESCLDPTKFSLKLDDASRLAIIVSFGIVHSEDSDTILSGWRDMSHPDFGKQRRVSAHDHLLHLDSSYPNSFDEVFHVFIELEAVIDQDPEVLAFVHSGDPIPAKLECGFADGIVTTVEDLMVRLVLIHFEAF